MSLKIIVIVSLLVILSVYVAFLNPQSIEISLTQSQVFHIPTAIFFFISVLVGVVASVITYFTASVKDVFSDLCEAMDRKRKERERLRWEILLEKGANALLAGNNDKALKFYGKIIRDNHMHVPALIQMGSVYRKQRNLDRAIQLHQSAHEYAPKNLQALFELADDYGAADMSAQQLQTLEKIRNQDGKIILAHTKKRDAYIKVENWRGAVDAQNRVVNLTDKREDKEKEKKYLARLLFNKACEHIEKGQSDTAISEFKNALKADPDCLPAHVKLGDLYANTGRESLAMKTWKHGFERTGSAACLMRWQQTMLEHKQDKEVIKTYETALKNSQPGEKENLAALLASRYLESGEPAKAIECLRNYGTEDSVKHALLLSNALTEQEETEAAQTTLDVLIQRLRRETIDYICGDCGSVTERWRAYCEECGSWNSLTCRFQLAEVATQIADNAPIATPEAPETPEENTDEAEAKKESETPVAG
ncbi:MAG: tetratricopeptide repeat protein [Candidatus Nitrohelix vancouverensis]|uniref:Tetratricopeptide repeat protein n=1 Tax=Candidatus Nitrohelix vancouverensis TaxID=2705534 RepID=A0A7T0C0Y4_9BACT|nr:MAG: tetratricopeptide repeat protein [Candidatus Nitrohelix vancouverensis]